MFKILQVPRRRVNRSCIYVDDEAGSDGDGCDEIIAPEQDGEFDDFIVSDSDE